MKKMKKSNLARSILCLLLLSLLLTTLALPHKVQVQALDLGNIERLVDIPDPNLHAALSKACGKKQTASHPYPLTNKDLAKLTGTLGLSGRNIKNLEGIQYCINVHSISASDNPLSNFPDMKDMEKLKSLHLGQCQLTEIPAALSQIPNLESLNLYGNQINDIGNLKGCAKLRDLDMSDNKISSIPAGLGLSSLVYLHLDYNNLTSFPEALLEYKQLYRIDLNGNKLKSLPDALGKMPELGDLRIMDNQLSSLPASLGSSNLERLRASYNQLTSLPASLFQSKTLDDVRLDNNALTELPESIANFQGDYICLELNYLDISQGSKTLQLINKMPTSQKEYKPLLTPIRNLKAVPGKDQIKLTWDPCQDATNEPGIEAYVSHYEVFLKEGDKLTSQGSIQKSASPSFIDTGLAPGAKRDYSIAVIYEIEKWGASYSSRHYRSISAEIKKEETTTTTTITTTTTTVTEPTTTEIATTISTTPVASTDQTETGIDAPDETDKIQNKGYLKWIILGVVLLLLVGAFLVWFLLIRPKRKKK